MTVDPHTRRLARQLAGYEARLKNLETVPQLAHSSIDDGAVNVYDRDGGLVAKVGKQDDGTYGAPPLDGPAPAMPVGITAVGGAGIVHVSWGGALDNGNPPPRDFDTLEILIDGALAGALPNRDGGTVTVEAAEGTRYVSARVRTLVPKHSSTTSPVGVTVAAPAERLFSEARSALEQTQGELDQAKADIVAEREQREQALVDAQAALDELDERLTEGPSTGDLEAIRADLDTARGIADDAVRVAGEANTAATAASQAALEAAGIAESKGRVIVSQTEPTGADRSAANIWIKPIPDDPDTEVEEKAVTHVYIAESDEWQATTSNELAQAAQNALDAREAAQQAQQRADTAVSNAATAQSAAEAAQRTADQATTDARGAHNAAVAAQEAADAAKAAAANLVGGGSFGQGLAGWQASAAVSVGTGQAHSGSQSARFSWESSSSTAELIWPEPVPVSPGQVWEFSAWVLRGKDVGSTTGGLRLQNSADGSTWGYGSVNFWGSDEWTRYVHRYTVPEGVAFLRARIAQQPLDGPMWVDDVALRDVTEAVALEQAAADARARADEAYSEAAAKATPAEVAAAAEAAEQAATAAAAADAKAKADQAKADALAGAATDAESKAAAAEAAAIAAASTDAKKKADKALADALAALSTARQQISAEITASANGKNAITVSSSGPSGSGVVVGDTWWRVDGNGDIFGQWSWNGSRWAARTVRSEVIANLDVGKLVVTGDTHLATAVIDRLFTDIFTAHKITAEQITIGALDENGELAPGSVGAITLQNGVVGADKIIADEVAAEVSHLVRAKVERLEVTEGATISDAVVLKLASEMITAGVLRTSETGQRVVIDRTGVSMVGLDADGVEYELVRIGPTGDNVITAGDTTISAAGVQAVSGDFGSLTVDGQSVEEILARYPRGLISYMVSTSASAWHGQNSDIRRIEAEATLEPGRRYKVTVDPHNIQTRTAGEMQYVVQLRMTIDGSTQNLSSMRHHLVATTNNQPIPALVGWTDTGSNDAPVDAVFGYTTRGSSGRDHRIADTDARLRITVEDMGPSLSATGNSFMAEGTAVQGSSDAPTEAPSIKRYTKTYSSTDFHTFDNNDNETSDADVVQGLYAGGPSRMRRRGGWDFPSMTGDLSGATVEKVEVYLYMNHSYYTAGATVNVATHNGTIRTSLVARKTITGWKRNTGKWITLPKELFDGFRTGDYRGVGVISTNTYAEQYARFNSGGAKIRITYTK